MKTIYVTTVFKLKEKQSGPCVDAKAYDTYCKMYELSKKSWLKNCSQITDVYLNSGTAKGSIHQVYKDHFQLVYDLWKDNAPCNILYCGPDTLCVEPIDFTIFKEYRIFNYTHGKSMFGFPHYFNNDIRYHPHTMSQETWDIGLGMAENWDMTEWATEQNIANAMFWSQDIPFADAHRPELAYQQFGNNSAKFNGIKAMDAKALHFHASKGAQHTYDKMLYVAKERGLI